MRWLRDRALTLVLMAMFLLFLAGQMITGFYEYNATQREHGEPAVTVSGYVPSAPAAGVPASVAVPFPLSTNVTPAGSEPDRVSVGAGNPVAVSATVPVSPT